MSLAFAVLGLGFGDESKGATVDKLCREYPVDLIVRFNGGAQAVHNVVLPNGHHHPFSQFGAGSLANQTVRTHLSRFMLVNPVNQMWEARVLPDNIWDRLSVHKDAPIILPWHREMNKIREDLRATTTSGRHGSCGQGIGECRMHEINHGDVVRAGDLKKSDHELWALLKRDFSRMVQTRAIMTNTPQDEIWKIFYNSVEDLMKLYRDWPARIVDTLPESKCMVFEGAQGVLLDETHGYQPHVTWTNCTFDNVYKILEEADRGVEVIKIGCIRSYHTRHGAGPFLTDQPGLEECLIELHNGTGKYQGAFRVGHFSSTHFERALEISGPVDFLAVSHLDRMFDLHISEEVFLRALRKTDGVGAIGMMSYGPTHEDRFLTREFVERVPGSKTQEVMDIGSYIG